MRIEFVRSAEKKEIISKLNQQFGIQELNYLLIKSGKEKIRAFSGNLSKDEISKLSEYARIEVMGLYFFKEEGDFRLTMDATHHLKDQIKSSIIELDDSQFHQWIRGNNIEFQKEIPKGSLIVKYKNDFYASGKSNGTVLFNYLPKDRRLKR